MDASLLAAIREKGQKGKKNSAPGKKKAASKKEPSPAGAAGADSHAALMAALKKRGQADEQEKASAESQDQSPPSAEAAPKADSRNAVTAANEEKATKTEATGKPAGGPANPRNALLAAIRKKKKKKTKPAEEPADPRAALMAAIQTNKTKPAGGPANPRNALLAEIQNKKTKPSETPAEEKKEPTAPSNPTPPPIPEEEPKEVTRLREVIFKTYAAELLEILAPRWKQLGKDEQFTYIPPETVPTGINEALEKKLIRVGYAVQDIVRYFQSLAAKKLLAKQNQPAEGNHDTAVTIYQAWCNQLHEPDAVDAVADILLRAAMNKLQPVDKSHPHCLVHLLLCASAQGTMFTTGLTGPAIKPSKIPPKVMFSIEDLGHAIMMEAALIMEFLPAVLKEQEDITGSSNDGDDGGAAAALGPRMLSNAKKRPQRARAPAEANAQAKALYQSVKLKSAADRPLSPEEEKNGTADEIAAMNAARASRADKNDAGPKVFTLWYETPDPATGAVKTHTCPGYNASAFNMKMMTVSHAVGIFASCNRHLNNPKFRNLLASGLDKPRFFDEAFAEELDAARLAIFREQVMSHPALRRHVLAIEYSLPYTDQDGKECATPQERIACLQRYKEGAPRKRMVPVLQWKPMGNSIWYRWMNKLADVYYGENDTNTSSSMQRALLDEWLVFLEETADEVTAENWSLQESLLTSDQFVLPR